MSRGPARWEAGGWTGAGSAGARDYDARFERLAAAGNDVHGEAALVWDLASGGAGGPVAVLDAGCGTGRVAVELARRGARVTGVDVDPAMLEVARAKAPALRWVEADLTDPELDLGDVFDAAVAAGNVVIFLPPAGVPAAVANLARHLAHHGLLVAGFQLGRPGAVTLDDYDASCRRAGLALAARWATWDRAPWEPGGDYAVSVHRRETGGDAQPGAGPNTRSV